MQYANGTVYDGRFKDGIKYGPGKAFFKNGDTFEGEWDKDLPNGEGKYFD